VSGGAGALLCHVAALQVQPGGLCGGSWCASRPADGVPVACGSLVGLWGRGQVGLWHGRLMGGSLMGMRVRSLAGLQGLWDRGLVGWWPVRLAGSSPVGLQGRGPGEGGIGLPILSVYHDVKMSSTG
jgi:hypothetical protein